MIKLTDSKKANQLYMQIKNIILEKEKNSSYKYKSSQYLDKKDIDDEIKKEYISEKGTVTFENINGELVTTKISRWHNYKRWSRYGIDEVPSFKAEIYIGKQLIWKLTSFYKGKDSEIEVSDLKIPISMLQEKQIPLQENDDRQIIDETEEKKNEDIMMEIKCEDRKKASDLYNEAKDILLSKEGKNTFSYEKKQHHLYEESTYPGISKDFFNENGKVEFENENKDKVRIEINRWHPHQHNGFSGLNSLPCRNAKIYKNEELIWELEIVTGTLTYKAKATSLEIPKNILKEQVQKEITKDTINSNVLEEKIEKTTDTRILFDEVKKLQNLYLNEQQEVEDLIEERNKKIEQETKRIMKEYEEKIKLNKTQNSVTKKQLKDFEKDISNYSSFNLETLGKCLENLISIFEGDKFIYKEATHEENTRIHGTMDSWDETVENKVKMIVKEPKYKCNYFSKSSSNNVINNLVNNGDAIILTETNNHSKFSTKICIYELIDNQLVSSVNFGKFDYIKEFLDNIIQFRFQNKKNDFNEEDMQEQMKIFLLNYKERILENQKQKFEEKVLTLKI